MRDSRSRAFLLVFAVAFAALLPLAATAAPMQSAGAIRGNVTLAGQEPLPGALVLLTDIGTSVRTDDDGNYVIAGVAPGTYTIVVSRQGVGSARATVNVVAGETTELDLDVELQGREEEVTVTASATGETTAFDTFNVVQTLDGVSMSKDMSGTLGEVLENEPGLAKRGFGSGAARPIIRGFDGDRVLVLDNGISTGDLSSQSGDHGVTIDPANVDRVEVVKGPATLLYGSNAIGGVVNAVSPDETFRTTPHDGMQVNGTLDGGTANSQLGGNANFIYSESNWMFYGGGGSRRTEDYDTPIGTVENSATELTNGRLGFGYFGDKTFFSFGYRVEDGAYGVPLIGELHGHGHEEEEHEEEEHDEEEHDEEEEGVDITLEPRRQSTRFDFGVNDLSERYVESLRVSFSAIDWHHDEVENFADGDSEIGTMFDNRSYITRAEFAQRKAGNLHGRFGAWYKYRDYKVEGEEALSPPVEQNALAGFIYEELDFTNWRLQFGGRVEYNGYTPDLTGVEDGDDHHDEEEGDDHDDHHDEEVEPPVPVDRSFTGFSGSVGARFNIAQNSAFVANFTSSYRAPALEELYNFGPHVGNLTFEVGNPNLERERSNGFDVSLRHDAAAIQGSINFFYYDIDNFVFLDLHDEEIDGLQVGFFTQGDSRFLGVDGSARARLHQHLVLEGSIGWVDAQLSDGTSLPRIPPVRGRIRVEIPYQGLRIEPEVIIAASQTNTFTNEEPTEGYTVWNLGGSYTLITNRAAHIFSIRGYNLSNELYFNHSSFIQIPEIGRGVKFGYALRLF